MSTRRSRYEILAKIASGGMATVYAGRVRGAVGFSRLVALKRPHPFVTEDPHLKQQLEAEARVASMIHHPNVVSVLDVEEIDEELVLVLEYVEGCTLKTLFDDESAHDESAHHESAGDPSFDRAAVRIVVDIAAGLHAAHRVRDAGGALLGVVHRDVSPQNVLVGVNGSARLTDFGIAKVMSSDADPTAADIMKGKTAYLPPEYVKLRQFDARSDLFALAVVTWEALARRRLFKGASTLETLTNVLAGDVPRLSMVRPELSAFDDVLARALSREPAERHESVEAFATALESSARAIDGVATHAEVGALVERVAGETIAARRVVLESGVAHALRDLGAAYGPASERDGIETVSLPEPPTALPPRPWRAKGAVVAVSAIVALSAGAVMLGAARGAAERPRAVTATDSPSASSTAVPFETSAPPENAGAAAPLDLAAAADGGATSKHGRGARPSPRGAASALLPVHAPPNPYSR